MLQNKKYIKFAYENTVEVISMGKIDQALDAKAQGNARAKDFEFYTAKDENGNKVERVVGWPNLTIEQMKKLNRSKAGQYNNTGKIPYTAIVNPHTLAEISNIRGGFGMGKLEDAVKAAKKSLGKEYGASVSRKTLDKIRKAEKKIQAGRSTRASLPRRSLRQRHRPRRMPSSRSPSRT